MLKAVIAALLALICVSTAQAAEDFGPAVGTQAPDIDKPLDRSTSRDRCSP
ncbi:hypothetical protein [Reyranella sp.]|uniref:hypothetical protein n=1 Tax=Reyranella sp. TaxID=1929291 RepID=UPI003BAC0B15